MIRRAEPEDIHTLIDMGQAFFVETGWSEKADFDSESFAITCGFLMDNGVSVVAEVGGEMAGMAGACIAPSWWNRTVLMGQEMFFYCKPNHRKGTGQKLFAGLEAAVKSLGVVLFSMSAEEGMRADALGRLYRQRSYVPMERIYWRALP